MKAWFVIASVLATIPTINCYPVFGFDRSYLPVRAAIRGRMRSRRVHRAVNPITLSTEPHIPKSVVNDEEEKERKRKRWSGILVLATVPLVWGTYAPSVKYMYEMGDASPPGLIFNLGCYLVSALTLAVVGSVNDRTRKGQGYTAALGSVAGEEETVSSESIERGRKNATWAGLELGGWLFLGGTVQVWGLELTSASRAAFLVQLTTVIVPLLEAALGKKKLKLQVWIACALATVGVTLVSLGGSLPPGTQLSSLWEIATGLLSGGGDNLAWSSLWKASMQGNIMGDLLVAASAFFYSMHVVRLGVHVSRVETLALAKSKAWFELGYTFMAVVVAAFAGGQGERFLRFGAILCSRPEVLLVVGLVAVWNGVVTSAYAMWAQTRGQAVVAPSEANLVYSIQPLWSTLFAVVLLKETFRTTQALGACLVITALVLSTIGNGNTPPDGLDQVSKVDSAMQQTDGSFQMDIKDTKEPLTAQ